MAAQERLDLGQGAQRRELDTLDHRATQAAGHQVLGHRAEPLALARGQRDAAGMFGGKAAHVQTGAEEVGAGQGRGTTINIPLPPGVGDTGFAAIYEQLIWPAALRFRPELIVVSAGFDAHWRDPLAQLRLSLTGYNHITRELIRMADEICGGRIVFAMEGGYDLEALAHAWRNVAHALLGDREVSDPLGLRPGVEPDLTAHLNYLRQLHTL